MPTRTCNIISFVTEKGGVNKTPRAIFEQTSDATRSLDRPAKLIKPIPKTPYQSTLPDESLVNSDGRAGTSF